MAQKRKYILGIDNGTTGTTAVLVNHSGAIQSLAYREFTQHFPQQGWVEHDAEEIWQVTLDAIKEAMAKVAATEADIHGVGITNQRETVVIWERETSKPIHRAIVWQCRRTSDICAKMKKDNMEALVRSRTGLKLDPYFSGTKIKWILDHVPEARHRARRGELLAGTIDSWLLWKFTGGCSHATDFTNASRTMIFDIHRCTWIPELLDYLQIPIEMLPKVQDSSSNFGIVAPSILSSDSGPHEIPICGIAGDQQAALYGHGCWQPGTAKNTYGTGCFYLLNTGAQAITSNHGLLTTLVCDKDGKPTYGLEGSIFMAGAIIQWLRDQLQFVQKASETEAIATSIESTQGVYLVPAFTGLGAPYWDQEARAAIVGLTRGSGKKEIVRAALEAIVYQTRDIVEAIKQDTDQLAFSQLIVDGGAVANNFLMQFQADILGVPVVRNVVKDTTVMGAVYLAGLRSKFWSTPEELLSFKLVDRTFEPLMPKEEGQRLYNGWKKAVSQVTTKSVDI